MPAQLRVLVDIVCASLEADEGDGWDCRLLHKSGRSLTVSGSELQPEPDLAAFG